MSSDSNGGKQADPEANPQPSSLTLKTQNSYFFFLVLSPNGKYNGQKLMKLVSTKMPASIIRTMPMVPGMMSMK